MFNRSILNEIERSIDQVGQDFYYAPATILTEDDLKCQLFRRLYQIPQLTQSKRTADENIHGSYIHTEFSWFNANGQLRIRPDISIIDPRYLSIYRSVQEGFRLPAKNASFASGDSIFIELKFYRGKRGIEKKSLGSIKKDIEKLNDLITRNQGFSSDKIVYGYVIVFSRYGEQQSDMEQLRDQHCNELVNLIYKTASVAPIN